MLSTCGHTNNNCPDTQKPYTCDDIRCPDGEHCAIAPVFCIRAPCPPQPQCIPDEMPSNMCGGIAGLPCPGNGKCVDDPNDNCDPEDAGADCAGICKCPASEPCKQGYVFDLTPEVCACVPDPIQNPCRAVQCEAGYHCQVLDDTADCVPDAPVCGGIAGTRCPGAGTCIDNPDDDCDPVNGGADCSGTCECNALGFCLKGYAWDSSPNVCNCVPLTNPCAYTLCQSGSMCTVINGSAVCVSDGELACGPNTCEKGDVCCNSSCGICTEPGMFCTQQACICHDKK